MASAGKSHISISLMSQFFVQSGLDERSIPGHTVAVQADMPFSGLTSFGTAFLSKFECSQMPHSVSCSGAIKKKLVDFPFAASGTYVFPID